MSRATSSRAERTAHCGRPRPGARREIARMLDSELHDTESSNDGPGSNSSAGLSDTPAATAAPRARTTRRRTAKSAAEPAPETKAAAQAATAAGPAAAAPAPGGDQAEDAAPKRPARHQLGRHQLGPRHH